MTQLSSSRRATAGRSECISSPFTDEELLQVTKPAQYLGNEVNAIHKDEATVDLHFGLCFPDTYEVGMSHTGLQILYDLINRDDATWAERVFMPMPDMESLLRRTQKPLVSLESKRPVGTFDILGFSLQYELCSTNIVAILDLAGIPFYSDDRTDQAPLIIGGGPFSYHPEPLAPFFDLFLLGDGEEAIQDILREFRAHRALPAAEQSREGLLKSLHQIEGVYVPRFFKPIYGRGTPRVAAEGEAFDDEPLRFMGIEPSDSNKATVVRRLLPSMNGAPYPRKPVVPNIDTVHNRLNVEVMRGCVRGCRFCQAGYLYRPQRERSPQEILQIVQDTLPETGFEELSLLSLSTADYCSIVPLLKTLMDEYGGDDRVAISFPSTRVDALTPEVLEQVQRVRRTGFTVAPEGGTQRLRDVINKGVSDEQIVETCTNVFRMGWSGIKLYFMLGLPTETDEDLRGIIDIAKRIRALPEAKGKDITVSVSTHVPKPHTPFQWAEQITPAETVRRQQLLAEGLRKARVDFRCHEVFSSFLEGVFCRAGRELAPTILRAYELGARLDAWQDHLKEEVWLQAFADTHLDPYHYLRERDPSEPLPWDHLSCGIPKEYFQREWQRATRFKPTPDCLKYSCSICQACDYDVRKNVLWPRSETADSFAGRVTPQDELNTKEAVSRVQLRFAKHGEFKFLGHLELSRVFFRAARRAQLPLCFTRGFHPLPRLVFGPPLALGVTSQEEFADAYFFQRVDTETLPALLNRYLPDGLEVRQAEEAPLKGRSLSERIAGFEYTLTAPWTACTGLVTTDTEATKEAAGKAVTEELEVVRRLRSSCIERARGNEGRGRRRPTQQFILDEHLGPITCRKEDGQLLLSFVINSRSEGAVPRATEIAALVTGLQLGQYSLEKTSTYFKDEKVAPTVSPGTHPLVRLDYGRAATAAEA